MIKLIKKEPETSFELPFFAKEIYLKTKTPFYGWFESEDFILPFTIFKNQIFKRMIFTTEVLQKEKTSKLEDEKSFLNELISFIKKNKLCDFIHKPQPSAVFKTFPDKSNPFRWGTYQLDSNSSLEDMINKMSKSQIRYTKKAIKEGVIVEKSENIQEIFNICNDTLKRQKIQLLMNKEEFEKQYKLFYPNNLIMFKATYQGEIQGALIIFFDKDTAYYEYGGSISRPFKGSLKLLHLSAIKYLHDHHGIQKYDFIGAVPDIIEGSKEAGIQKFKKEFGSVLKKGYQFSVIINPFKYFLFNLSIKTLFAIKGIKYLDPIEKNKMLSKSRLKV